MGSHLLAKFHCWQPPVAKAVAKLHNAVVLYTIKGYELCEMVIKDIRKVLLNKANGLASSAFYSQSCQPDDYREPKHSTRV